MFPHSPRCRTISISVSCGFKDANDNDIDMDDLSYTYDKDGLSNLLVNVADAVTTGSNEGFKDGNTNPALDDYEYDANGNMIKDRNKGISNISYNHLNLPTQIEFEGTNDKITYLYNSVGQKLKKTVVYSDSIKIVDYLDGFQYAGNILQFFPHAEGYVKVTPTYSRPGDMGYAYNYVYNYTDHLGNIRVSYSKDPRTNQLKILEENHYYPFGLKHSVYTGGRLRDFEVDFSNPEEEQVFLTPVTKTEYQYKYNGQEWQDELGLNMYAMDMRQYDPAIARWVVQDPVIHHSMSPYNAFDNNPVFWADPSGADATSFIQDLWDKTPEGSNSYWVNTESDESDSSTDDHFDQYGNYLYTDDKETNNIIIHTPTYIGKSSPFSAWQPAQFKEVELKNYYFTTVNDFILLLRILAYYAPNVGVNPANLQNGEFSIAAFYETKIENGLPYGIYKYHNNEKGSYHKYAIGTGGNSRITVMLRNGKINPLINDKYNLMSFIYHEGGARGHLGMPNADHATIYRNQMEHPLFKFTTPDFKEHVYSNYNMYGGK